MRLALFATLFRRRYGPNLAPGGGTFDSSTGWTVNAGWAIGSGVATATATSASLLQAGVVTAGKTYLVEFDWTHTSGTLAVRIGAGTQVTYTTSGRKSVNLTANNAAGVEFYGGAVTGVLDNVSVRQVL